MEQLKRSSQRSQPAKHKQWPFDLSQKHELMVPVKEKDYGITLD